MHMVPDQPNPGDELSPGMTGDQAEAYAAGYDDAMKRAAVDLPKLMDIARENGYKAGLGRATDDAPKIYQLGYDAGVRDTEMDLDKFYENVYAAGMADARTLMARDGVDPEAVAALTRISDRLSRTGTPAPVHRLALLPSQRSRRAAR